MSALRYSAKVPIIINYTISATDTWEQITGTPVAGVRRWFIKTSEDTDNEFRLAFSDSPSTYLTSDGSGFAFDECDLPPVWVYCSTSSTQFEILYWS